MPDKKTLTPLQALVFGQLSEEENADLAWHAMDDQEVFDELWEALEQREALQDPLVRNRLLRSLDRNKQRWWGRSWAGLPAPLGRFALAGAVALAMAILVWQGLDRWGRDHGQFKTATVVTDSNSDPASFFDLPLHSQLEVTLDLNRQSAIFHIGEVVHASLRLRESAAVFVLRRRSDGQTRIVFPPDLSATADLKAGATAITFDPLPPTDMISTPQSVTLRIIVLPLGIDIRSESINWAKVRGAYAVQELRYDVAP